jgi:nucleoside-diphosphate-sugar epimerase
MAGIMLKAKQTVLVSGASGFIGRGLCARLCEEGVRVRGLMRKAAAGPWNEAALYDIGTEAPPEYILSGVDTVFHLAGKAHALSESRQEEDEYFRINMGGTLRLLEAANRAGVRRFVLFSSVKSMGEGGEICEDESVDCKPTTAYGKSKLDAERLVLEGNYVAESVVLRLSMVYGPSSKGNLPRMIDAVAKGHFPPLPEVHNRRSMVHVGDVVEAALLAAGRLEAAGHVYIVTDGQMYSSRQVYEWICEALDMPVPNWRVPIGVLKAAAKAGDCIGWALGRRFMFDTEGMRKLLGSACYSSKKIRRELGFAPKYDLRSALPDIVAHLGMK